MKGNVIKTGSCQMGTRTVKEFRRESRWSRGASSETSVDREASAGRWHMEGDLRDEKNQTGSRLSGGSAPGDRAPEGTLRG